MKKSTIAIQQPYIHPDPYGAIAMPVYHTDAYEFADATTMSDAFCGRSADPDYSRVTNPTVMHFEDRVKAITGARHVIAMNSGMAAISGTMLTLARAGKNIVTSRHMFGNTFALLSKTLTRFGVECRDVDLLDLDAVRRAVDGQTCCIFFEILTNPQLEVADTRALAEIAHAAGIPLVADTTTIPFTEFDAQAIGIDIEIVSSTKYISGGATCLGGLVIVYNDLPEGFVKAFRTDTLMNFGAYMTPHAAYMQTLGLENLKARYALQSANTRALAQRLRRSGLCTVNYIGFDDAPGHSLFTDLYGPSGGAMITLDLRDREACFSFMNRLRLVKRATNLYDNKTLAIHPASTIFGNFTEQQRREMDVKETTIRLSVGLEDVDDIFADLAQALA